MEIFTEISSIILLVTAVSFVMKLLKQPFIVGYILTGIIVGPFVLNLLRSTQNVEFLSQIGITILLFIVGLGLNPKVLHEVGKISLITGIGQVVFTSTIGYLLCRTIGLDHLSSIYISIALTFSSTIIILKILTDKGDIDALYGKISIGFLLVQDIIATIILIIVSSVAYSQTGNLTLTLSLLAIKGLLAGSALLLTSKIIIPKALHFASTSQELLFLFSIAWCIVLSSVFYQLGFSIEIGALIAGITLSSTPFAPEIGSRMKPLRDFFILLFFILLGSQMLITALPQILIPSLLLSLFVLIGNPLVVFILMNLLGYKKKTGFMAGLTVAQISEFSLILAKLGFSVGHISENSLSLITLVGLITIAGSTYLIIYADNIYRLLEKYLTIFEWRKISNEKSISTSKPADIILFGYDRAGPDFVKAIKKLGKNFLIVDHNPEVINRLQTKSLPNAYGDADDAEFLIELGIQKAKLVISTIPSYETNKLIVELLHNSNPQAISIVPSHHISDTLDLYKSGASYVIMPIYLGARYATHMIIRHGLDRKSFAEEKSRHLKHLKKQQSHHLIQ